VTADEGARVLGVDLGEARIGLALSDPLGVTAQPLETLVRQGARADLAEVARIAREREVRAIVVGLPLRLDGDEGPAAEAARRFARRLEGRLPGVRLEFWDERLTTVLAERTMISGRARRARRRERVDTVAAVLILQSWLDAHRHEQA
jgi:putative Holliday junction resolvase